MNNLSIEFQGITKDQNPLSEIVRKSFRIPVEDRDKAWIYMQGERYRVIDICPDGVGIALDKKTSFTLEQIILNCELNIFNISIKNLSAKIVHLTLVREKNWHCGIQWIDKKKDAADKISAIVFRMKEQLLKGETISLD